MAQYVFRDLFFVPYNIIAPLTANISINTQISNGAAMVTAITINDIFKHCFAATGFLSLSMQYSIIPNMGKNTQATFKSPSASA